MIIALKGYAPPGCRALRIWCMDCGLAVDKYVDALLIDSAYAPRHAADRERDQALRDLAAAGCVHATPAEVKEPTEKQPAKRVRKGVGKGWHGEPERHSAAGKLGGPIISQDREHMSAIGRKGGTSVSRDREYMAALGRKGGKAKKRPAPDQGDTRQGGED